MTAGCPTYPPTGRAAGLRSCGGDWPNCPASPPADSDGSPGSHDIPAELRLSGRMLELFLRRELFNLEELRPLSTNPMRQVGYLNVGGYVKRNYAPLADRLRSATEALGQVPEFLQVLEASLDPEVGRPVLEMSIESYRGMARFYRVDLDHVK